MKRCVSIILALIFVLSFASCGNNGNGTNSSNDSNTPKEPTPIELTVDNIKDYVAFEFDYDEVKKETVSYFNYSYYLTALNLNAYTTVDGTFSNLQIQIEVAAPFSFTVPTDSKGYDSKNDEIIYCSFRIPSSGDYSASYKLRADYSYSSMDLKPQRVQYTITSVSGTFTPNK